MKELTGESGFGYGIKKLANTQAARSHPLDITIDQQTGVALTAAGYFHTGFDAGQVNDPATNIIPE